MFHYLTQNNLYLDLEKLIPNSTNQIIDWEALQELFPALRLLSQTPQDSIYHAEGDVWTHTKMVCESLRTLPDFVNANPERRFVLFYAALLHDIAKATCTVFEDNGRISSAGHSKRGAIDARIALWKMGVPFDVRERICRLIACHQIPFFALADNRHNQSPEFIVRKLSTELSVRELAALSEADMLGRIYKDQQTTLDNIALFSGCQNTTQF